MQLVQRWQYTLLLMVGLLASIAACKNNSDPEPVLGITGFTPSGAAPGAEVTITGMKFSTTPANNVVLFGTVPAEVKSATETQLVVLVPVGAGSGPISVTSGGATVQSTASFTPGARPVVEVVGDIKTNTTWSNKNIYLLKGFVYVNSGATLTIEKGTLIKGAAPGDDPSGAQKGGTLTVEQGGKIIAIGTPDQPIVFTSNKPKGQRNYGDWGGLVLVGKAPHNQPGATGLEGGLRGTMGTFSDVNDNSGTLQYVRIEFAGVALTQVANSEINGLTLYGVGAGTTIDHVQVSYSGDDSIEWFGGTVNAKYLIALRGWDDDWDTDWGWSGKVQYGVALRDPLVADQSASNGFESDNFNPGEPATGPNAGLPLTEGVFANMSNFVFNTAPSADKTAKGSGPFQSGMHIRRNTSLSVFNSLLVGYPEGLRLDGTATGTLANANADKIQLRGIVFANMGKDFVGKGVITDQQATDFFNKTGNTNQVVTTANLGTLLLNPASFNLTAPNFLPQTGSPLLTGAVWTGKGADAFFTKETFRGAFGTTDWTKGWANWDPQNADYDK
jgi:hypothetical protein